MQRKHAILLQHNLTMRRPLSCYCCSQLEIVVGNGCCCTLLEASWFGFPMKQFLWLTARWHECNLVVSDLCISTRRTIEESCVGCNHTSTPSIFYRHVFDNVCGVVLNNEKNASDWELNVDLIYYNDKQKMRMPASLSCFMVDEHTPARHTTWHQYKINNKTPTKLCVSFFLKQ